MGLPHARPVPAQELLGNPGAGADRRGVLGILIGKHREADRHGGLHDETGARPARKGPVGVGEHVNELLTHVSSGKMGWMPVDPQLLEILACPDDHHAPVREEGDYLVCTECRRRFPVRDGIPVMLLEEALPPA